MSQIKNIFVQIRFTNSYGCCLWGYYQFRRPFDASSYSDWSLKYAVKWLCILVTGNSQVASRIPTFVDSEYRDEIVLVSEMVADRVRLEARAEHGLDRGWSSSAVCTYTSTYLNRAHQLFISSKLILKEADRTKRQNKWINIETNCPRPIPIHWLSVARILKQWLPFFVFGLGLFVMTNLKGLK